MKDYQMGAIESRFADIIWQNEPIPSGELVVKAQSLLGWKKSTTYTVLKRLCEKGVFVSNGGVVSSLIKKEELYAIRSESFVNDEFGGSLPAFLAAFTARKALTEEEVAELRRIVDEYTEV